MQIIVGRNATSTTDSLGLELVLSSNATQVSTDQNIGFSAALYNTLSRAVNLTGESSGTWKFPFMGFALAPDPQCYWNGPFEFVVLSGNYSTSSLRGLGGSGLAFPIMCMEGGAASWYLFQPQSDNATMWIPACPICDYYTSSEPASSNATVVMSGYWNVPTPQPLGGIPTMPAPSSWTPGVYTIAVGDPWGDIVALHFAVEGASVTSSPYVCFVLGVNRLCTP